MNAHVRRRALVTTLFTVLLVGAGAAVGAGSAHAAGATNVQTTDAALLQDDTTDVEVTLEYERTDDPDVVRIHLTAPAEELPPGTTIDVEPFGGYEDVDEVNGLEESYGTLQRYDVVEGADQVNATFEYEVPTDDSYVDSGEEWAFIEQPSEQRWINDDVSLEFTHEPATGHASADGWIWLGPHEKATTTVDGAELNVVFPTVVSDGSPERVLEALETVHAGIDAGDVDGPFTAFGHPSPGTSNHAIDDDTAKIQVPGSGNGFRTVWIHEHAHLLDGTLEGSYRHLGGEMTWFTEAYAKYQERRWAVKMGYDSYERFRTHVENASEFDETLAVQDDPTKNINYHKGSAVLLAIDREIRLATDGEKTFMDVHEQMTQEAEVRDDDVSRDEFTTMIANVSNDEAVAEQADDWITTTAAPEAWSRTEHVQAFGPQPDVEVDLGAVRVENTAGVSDLDIEDPRELTPNERIVVEYTATNAGEEPGLVSAGFQIDNLEIAKNRYAEGQVAPGEETTVRATYDIEEPMWFHLVYEDDEYVEVTATLADVDGNTPQDLNGDGLRRDVSGDGSFSNSDITLFFQKQHTDVIQDHWPAYDFDGDGGVGQSDVIRLFEEL